VVVLSHFTAELFARAGLGPERVVRIPPAAPPLVPLDPERRTELAAILKELVTRGRTLIVATHDEDFAAAAATRIVRMEEGRVLRN
jgi:ABC-type ATPase involved in cell division